MNRFERFPVSVPNNNPEKPIEDSASFKTEKSFEPDKAVKKEKGLLDKFKGKARHLAGVLILVSTGCSSTERASTEKPDGAIQNTPTATRTMEDQEQVLLPTTEQQSKAVEQSSQTPAQQEQLPSQEPQIEVNKENLTSASEVFTKISNTARSEIKQLRTKQDLEWYMHSNFDRFIGEYFVPTEGQLTEVAYGLQSRNYSVDDMKLMLLQAQEIKGMLETAQTKIGVEGYDTRSANINRLIEVLESRTSYAGQKQAEQLERLEKAVQEYNK